MKKAFLTYANISIGVFVVIVAVLLARQYLAMSDVPENAVGAGESPAKDNAVNDPKAKDRLAAFKRIASSGVFGKGDFSFIEPDKKAEAGVFLDLEAEITLVGTVVGPSNASFAIFEDNKTRKQEVIAKGDKVFDIGVLSGIEKDKAVVDVNGRPSVIYMPEDRPPKKTEKEVRADIGPSGASEGLAGIAKGITQRPGEGGFTIDSRALDTVLANMGKVLTDARLMPYSEDGKIAGFRVSEIKPGGVFSLIGLREGDVLVKVNDYAIDSPEKGVQLISGLKGETRLTLDIIRNNRPKQLNYQIR
jgi:general secretion pathway protein C